MTSRGAVNADAPVADREEKQEGRRRLSAHLGRVRQDFLAIRVADLEEDGDVEHKEARACAAEDEREAAADGIDEKCEEDERRGCLDHAVDAGVERNVGDADGREERRGVVVDAVNAGHVCGTSVSEASKARRAPNNAL